MTLHPMSELTSNIKDEDIFIFESFFNGGNFVARMIINDRWENSACGWCYREEYVDFYGNLVEMMIEN